MITQFSRTEMLIGAEAVDADGVDGDVVAGFVGNVELQFGQHAHHVECLGCFVILVGKAHVANACHGYALCAARGVFTHRGLGGHHGQRRRPHHRTGVHTRHQPQ